MNLNRTLRAGFALLVALMLPLQGYTAMPDCGHSIAASPAAGAHCSGGPNATHRHGCGTCCCTAAMALTAIDWIAPRRIPTEVSLALLWSPPTVTLDRLERPPRFVPA